MNNRRLNAIAALLLFAASIVALVVTASRAFPRGLLMAVLIALAFGIAWEALRRPGRIRMTLVVLCAVMLLGAFAMLVTGRVLAEAIISVALFWLSTYAARRAFRIRGALPPAPPPTRAVMFWNARSGGGKAAAAHLDDEARKRGIEPIELFAGDDWEQVVRDAVTGGADGLAAAGGDGTQALVATIAAEFDLPFACIPAGTRNHFALDLGVDRDDVVGALDAFVGGGERRVDLAEINGRVFVNNVSLGLYAQAVQSAGYRDAKLRTVLAAVPEFIGSVPTSDDDLRYTGPSDITGRKAIIVMVSNNSYRLGNLIGAGTRPRYRRWSARRRRACCPGGRRPPSRLAPVDRRNLRCRVREPGTSWGGWRGADVRPAAAVQDPEGRGASAHRPAASRCVAVGCPTQRSRRRDQAVAANRPYRLIRSRPRPSARRQTSVSASASPESIASKASSIEL